MSDPRRLLHRRDITLLGYARPDGAVDVDAHLIDVKTYDFQRDDGSTRHAGEPVHDMTLRVTVSRTLDILAVETGMAAHPYRICPGAGAAFQSLVGLSIKPGFVRAAMSRVGGTAGCTHLRELLQQIATVAIQTLYSLRDRSVAPDPERRPPLLDTCYAFASDREVVAERFPRWAAPPR